MFTAEPVTGDRSVVVVDASSGLGEAVVSGLVTPDHYVLDASGEVRNYTPGRREVVIRSAAGGGVTRSEKADATTLPDTVPAQGWRRRSAGRSPAHFGRPQDVEWAYADGRVWLVQARPMTALPPPLLRLTRRQRAARAPADGLHERPAVPARRERLGAARDRADGAADAGRDPRSARGRGRDAAERGGWSNGSSRACLNSPRRCSPRRSASRASFAGTTRPPGPRTRATHGSRGRVRARGLDLAASSWPQLMHTVRRALAATDLITDLRVDYLPGSGGAAAAARGAGATRPAWADRAACSPAPGPAPRTPTALWRTWPRRSRRSGAALRRGGLDAATLAARIEAMRGSPSSASSCAGSSPSTATRETVGPRTVSAPTWSEGPRRCSAWSRCWSRSRRGGRRRSRRGRGTASARASARPPRAAARPGCAACSTPRGRDWRCRRTRTSTSRGYFQCRRTAAGGEAVGWSGPGSSASPTRSTTCAWRSSRRGRAACLRRKSIGCARWSGSARPPPSSPAFR